MLAVIGAALATVAMIGSTASPPPPAQATSSATLTAIPGREADARVAEIAYRLATAGQRRCPVTRPALGLVLTHLSQFERGDRPGMIAALTLDRGPGVISVLPGSPAALAGFRPGDVVLGINGRALPPEDALSAPFDAARAHTRADAIANLLDQTGPGAFTLTVLRDGAVMSASVSPAPACPSRVHLARSAQRNAYADGRHVFITTGLLARTRSDDDLAFIIAHEMAHNILQHAAVMKRERDDAAKRSLREIEREADDLGGRLMLDASYDPVTGTHVLERLGGAFGIGLFTGHDSAGKRIAAMQSLVQASHPR